MDTLARAKSVECANTTAPEVSPQEEPTLAGPKLDPALEDQDLSPSQNFLGTCLKSSIVIHKWFYELCWAEQRSRPMRLKTLVTEGVPASRSRVRPGTIQSHMAWARAPRSLNPTGRAGYQGPTPFFSCSGPELLGS